MVVDDKVPLSVKLTPTPVAAAPLEVDRALVVPVTLFHWGLTRPSPMKAPKPVIRSALPLKLMSIVRTALAVSAKVKVNVAVPVPPN